MTFGDGAAGPSRAAPVFAQHADEVLARAGYDKEQIEQLRRDSVIP
jgi:crotonobetainyl-CoA:carnitine CoA-transferase CaiB-like acyl-CoA transferase